MAVDNVLEFCGGGVALAPTAKQFEERRPMRRFLHKYDDQYKRMDRNNNVFIGQITHMHTSTRLNYYITYTR